MEKAFRILIKIQDFLSGENQKIISFSFYGKLKSVYYNGIKENLNSIDVSYHKLLTG